MPVRRRHAVRAAVALLGTVLAAPPAAPWGWRATRPAPSASVLKAMLLVAYLQHPAVRDRRLRSADQTRFFRRIDALVTPRHRAVAMSLLASIIPAQRWGIGQVRPRGWKLYFKGGWGSATGAVEHQVALVRRGDRRVAAAVLITSSPSHAYAKRTLRGVFARLLRGL